MARYTPEIYEVRTLEEAKHAITSPDRWEKETEYLVEEIGDFLKPTKETKILDYGCGVGRLAKPLIEKFNCSVIGTEISLSMQRLAIAYVQSSRFSVCLPSFLSSMIAGGFQVDHALAVWVLQHCPDVEDVIQLIKEALKSEGQLYVANNKCMLIPTDNGWVDDGRDVRQLLQEEFVELNYYDLSEAVAPKEIAERSYISLFSKGVR